METTEKTSKVETTEFIAEGNLDNGFHIHTSTITNRTAVYSCSEKGVEQLVVAETELAAIYSFSLYAKSQGLDNSLPVIKRLTDHETIRNFLISYGVMTSVVKNEFVISDTDFVELLYDEEKLVCTHFLGPKRHVSELKYFDRRTAYGR